MHLTYMHKPHPEFNNLSRKFSIILSKIEIQEVFLIVEQLFYSVLVLSEVDRC